MSELLPSREALASPYQWTIGDFYSLSGRNTKIIVAADGVWFYREFCEPSWQEITWEWERVPLAEAIGCPTWHKIAWKCEPDGLEEEIVGCIRNPPSAKFPVELPPASSPVVASRPTSAPRAERSLGKSLAYSLCAFAIVALVHWIYADSIQAYLRGVSAWMSYRFGEFTTVEATYVDHMQSRHASLAGKNVFPRPNPTIIEYYRFQTRDGDPLTVMLEHATPSSSRHFLAALEARPNQPLLRGSVGSGFGYFEDWPVSKEPYEAREGLISRLPNASWAWALWCIGVLTGLCLAAVIVFWVAWSLGVRRARERVER